MIYAGFNLFQSSARLELLFSCGQGQSHFSPSQRLIWAHSFLPDSGAKQNASWLNGLGNVTTLLLWVVWSFMFPGLRGMGQFKVHSLLLMKTFARVGDEVAQLIPTFPTKGSAPRLTLQVPDRFKTSAALLRAEPWRSSGEDCVSNLPENQGSCLKQGLCRSLFNLLLRCSSYFNA